MSYQTVAIDWDPIVCDPRNPYKEPVLNIAALLEEFLTIEKQKYEFGDPFIARVNAGRFRKNSPPAVWPAVDIGFVRRGSVPPNRQAHGSSNVSVLWPLDFEVRYFYAEEEKTVVDDLEVTAQLYRIADLLEWRNDVHGLCPRPRSSIVDVTQSSGIVSVFPSLGEIAGGSISIHVPMWVDRSYFDGGQSPRDMKMQSGARK